MTYVSSALLAVLFLTSFAIQVRAAEEPNSVAITYQWQRQLPDGTWMNLTEGGSYSGTATAELKVNNAIEAMNDFQFRCVVGSGNATVESEPAKLVVTPPPAGEPGRVGRLLEALNSLFLGGLGRRSGGG